MHGASGAHAAEEGSYALGDLTKGAIATTAPAFGLLGVDAKDIQRPETLRQFGTALLSGLDQDGKFKAGLAVQAAPALLINPDAFQSADYVASAATRALARWEVTAAFAKATGADDDSSLRGAIGFLWTPFDTGDPYANAALIKCLQEVSKDLRPPPPETAPVHRNAGAGGGTPTASTVADPNEAARENALQGCRTKHDNRGAATTLQLGAAPLFVSKSGSLDDLKGKGYALSSVLAQGLNGLFALPKDSKFTSQIIVGITYRRKEQIDDPTAAAGATNVALVSRNRLSIGGKLSAGNKDSFLIGLELLSQRATYEGAIGKDRYVTYAIVAEKKLSGNIWATLTLGDTSGRNIGKSPQYVGTGLKFSFDKRDADK